MFLFKRDLLLIDHFIITSVWSECDEQSCYALFEIVWTGTWIWAACIKSFVLALVINCIAGSGLAPHVKAYSGR